MGLMKTFVSQGHEIACLTVASHENHSKIKSELEASGIFSLGCFVISHDETQYSGISKLLFWFIANPIKLIANQNLNLKNEFQSIIETAFENLKIDIIHCLSLRTSYFLTDLPSKPIVIDLVDSFTNHKIRALKYHLLNFRFKQLLFSIVDLFKTIRIERNIASIYSTNPISVVSSVDKKILTKINSNCQIHVVTFGSDIETKHCNFLDQNTDKVITFYGFLEQIWNHDALCFLVNEIIPRVLIKHPDTKLLLTGRNISDEILGLSQKFSWIEAFPTVDNISDFAAKATLNCWPFRFGSGFKTKILESMYLSKPIVATTIGAEALTESQKKGLLIADTAQGLADHIIYLLDNPNERIRLGEINYEVATTEFTWERKAQDYLQLYQLAQDKFKHKNQ
ncbi:hypothetical protein AWQ24_07625 [Picosynechococcus sp. PCC 8807]|nr:hypothetical protein AWQ24_07625 [Picosynechococcus sp. PCC 8807]